MNEAVQASGVEFTYCHAQEKLDACSSNFDLIFVIFFNNKLQEPVNKLYQSSGLKVGYI